MKITFDLDGTICSSDWGWLEDLRNQGYPEKEELRYYACCERWLNPFKFLGVNDEALILTGRPIHLRDVTKMWLRKNGLDGIPVIFTKTLKKPKGTMKEFRKVGEDKAKLLLEMEVDVHFDDNEEVVKTIREITKGKVKVIHYGSHVYL